MKTAGPARTPAAFYRHRTDQRRSAHAIAVPVIAATPTAIRPPVVAVISRRIVAVIDGGGRVVSPIRIIPVPVIGSRERAADDGADGEAPERGAPPPAPRIRCRGGGDYCSQQARRR